ncbi:MAG TPA: prepilin-type N-terminal cleavage/methylation domain-containing protein [Candidatus Saccharimonadales bacterium]|nr:prepilin-type N-terminal cleavage/methylation domain-containing protein [Candidatus Saccharimonadales bacterium]
MLAGQRQGGFTLIELLLSMAVFSFGLLIILSGLVSLLGLYTNGRANRVVQNAARTGINMISQHGREGVSFSTGNNILCIDTGGGSGSMFYLTPTHQLMFDDWDQSQDPPLGCVLAATTNQQTPMPVTSSDAPVIGFTAEAVTYDATNNSNPCTSGCTSVRVSLRVASTTTGLNSDSTACSASSTAACVVSTVSTTITAGEHQ